jgi:hypothetical protein
MNEPKTLSAERGGGSLERVVRARCEYCEQERVPQYDIELKLAGDEIAKWKDIARRLYLARGCKKREHLRITAEAAYLKYK